MKRFTFSLQALRTLRNRQHQTALEHYSRALQTRQTALNQLAASRNELETAWSRRREQQSAGVPALALAQTQAWCDTIESRVHQLTGVADQAQQILAQALQKLMAARKNQEAVEQFFDHQKQCYDRQMQRDEQRALDDLTAIRVAASMLAHLPGGNTVWN